VLWNIILGLAILGTNRYGEYITDECPQESYSCPKICDVDHKHLPLKECNNAKTEQESRPDSTIIPSGRQLIESTVAANKSERI